MMNKFKNLRMRRAEAAHERAIMLRRVESTNHRARHEAMTYTSRLM